MIGFFYFLTGIFSLIILIIIVIFALAFQATPYQNCGLGFYSTLLLIGIASIVVYGIVTYKYKRRERQPIGNDNRGILRAQFTSN